MSTRRALLFSFMDRYAGLVVSIGSSMVIARLLTPAEIGVFSVAMVMLSFLQALRDFGAGQYLVQEKQLDTERIRAVWTVQLITGFSFCIVAWLAAAPVARYYNDVRIENIMRVIALNFAVSPFGSLTYAWLMREMRFGSLAVMRFAGNLGGAAVSITLAWYGYGPISLAIGSLSSTVVNALIAAKLRPSHFPWLPGVLHLRRVISFGGAVSGESLLNALSEGAPDLLLAKFQSMTGTGLFSRAFGLVSMCSHLFTDAIHSVAFGALAKEAREQGNVSALFVKATLYLTAVGWTFLLWIAVMAEPLVQALYGDQWRDAVPLVKWISLAWIFGLPASFCGATLIAIGKPRVVLKVAIANTVQRVVLCLVGALVSTQFLAVCLIISFSASSAIWFGAFMHHIDLRLRDLAQVAWRSGVVSVISIAPIAGGVWLLSSVMLNPVVALLLSAIALVPIFLTIARITSHPIFDEVSVALQAMHSRFAVAKG